MTEEAKTTHAQTWAWGITRSEWGETYSSQGPGTNDCGPTNLAMLLNALTTGDWDKTKVHPRLRFPDLLGWLDKLISFITCGKFNPGAMVGASHPKGIADEFNRIAKDRGLDKKAVRVSKGPKAELLREVRNGNPVTVILIWENGGAHYVTIISYSEEDDTVFYMDPSDEYKDCPPSDRIRSRTWEAFDEDWSRQVWWTKLLGLKSEMIVYKFVTGPAF